MKCYSRTITEGEHFDTLCRWHKAQYVKTDVIDALAIFNCFHLQIKFTYELEDFGEIAFLGLLLVGRGSDIKTTVYQKPTHNDMYLHWDSFAPESWKRETLKTLLLRAHIVCSSRYLLEKEIKHLEQVFVKLERIT